MWQSIVRRLDIASVYLLQASSTLFLSMYPSIYVQQYMYNSNNDKISRSCKMFHHAKIVHIVSNQSYERKEKNILHVHSYEQLIDDSI